MFSKGDKTLRRHEQGRSTISLSARTNEQGKSRIMASDRLRASIVIVTYNGLRELTAPCLESIFKNTPGSDYEVIVVDNASTDGTRDYLKNLSDEEPRLTIVLNNLNRGFSAGNNDGIRISRGENIVLLNNDTRVTKGWLSGLLNIFDSDPSIGLAGPVSNSVGNEQQIFIEASEPEDIIKEASRWCDMASGDTFETEMLGFFCVAMRRSVVEKVGVLDESFGLGYFEDDDYCMRVKRAGYTLVCVEGVFVYHRGSASFVKVPDTDRNELSTRNKTLFEEKHRKEYKPRSLSELQMALIDSYLLKSGKSAPTAGMVYKINNKLKLLHGLRPPKGLIKRIRLSMKASYYRKLVASSAR